MYKIHGEDAYEASDNQIQSTNEVSNIVTNSTNTNSLVVNQVTEGNQSQTVVIPSVSGNTTTQTSVPVTSKPPTTTTSKSSTYEYNNRYYYNQLDNYSKVIYDAIANNIGNLKLGSYLIEVNYDFSQLLKQADGESRLKKYYDDAINALNLDVPNLFYIDFSKMWLNIDTTTTMFETKYKLYLDTGKNFNYFSAEFSSQSQVENAINETNNIKNQICRECTGDTYNKIKKAHDWIINNLSYSGASANKGSVYGAFIEKRAVCEGYARALKCVLDSMGITNILATGTATNSNGSTEDHMWNYVKINSTWYAVDATWDDPITYGGASVSEGVKHKYFLIGSDDLFKTHKEKDTISTSGRKFKLPTLSKVKY